MNCCVSIRMDVIICHYLHVIQGQPSGEAFIQMDSEQSAAQAASMRHHKYMVFGKKQRYIEVFQCSIDDMNLVLTGGVPVQRPHLQAGKLDPGGLRAMLMEWLSSLSEQEETCCPRHTRPPIPTL